MSKTAEETYDKWMKLAHEKGFALNYAREQAMEEYAQAYRTAKLEEVAGSAEYWKAEHDAQVHKCNKFQMEISTLKAEIANLKEANIEYIREVEPYRVEVEPTCESCIFFTADDDVPPCSICKFCDNGAKESMHQPIKQ